MAPKIKAECERSHPGEFALRPTAKGDICILFGTNLAEEIDSLRTRQAALQSLYGGRPMPLIHLTYQRFSGLDVDFSNEKLDALVHEIEALHPNFSPIPVTAVTLVPLYVPFERQNVLKWCVDVSDDLRAFADRLRSALERAQIVSLYKPWFVPTLVTALKGLPSLEERIDPENEATKFPQHLFTGRHIEISRINARNDYDILATFDW
jgi:hypothetical protein